MKKLHVSAALVAASLSLSALPAVAADNAPSPDDAKALCGRLTSQFDFLMPFKEGLPYWKKASEEFHTGRQECAAGKSVAGAEAMQSAISDMYVKPDALPHTL